VTGRTSVEWKPKLSQVGGHKFNTASTLRWVHHIANTTREQGKLPQVDRASAH